MIVRLADYMLAVHSRFGKLLMQVASGRLVAESVVNTSLYPLQAYLQWRQQDHVVKVGQACRAYEGRQEPWPKDTVIDHRADLGQPAGSRCSCLNDHRILSARLRQPRQDVSLFDHGEETVARDERAWCKAVGQVLRHRRLAGPRRPGDHN